jgi:hypothetical protein
MMFVTLRRVHYVGPSSTLDIRCDLNVSYIDSKVASIYDGANVLVDADRMLRHIMETIYRPVGGSTNFPNIYESR